MTATDIPEGLPEWVTKFVDCAKPEITFYPGTRDGVEIEAQVRVPIALHTSGHPASTSSPEPPTDPTHIEEAYRVCYPPDQAAMGSVVFSFDVNANGSISNAKVLRGSGDAFLDKAGACILPRLRFTPMMHGGVAVKSKVISWELPIRPPR